MKPSSFYQQVREHPFFFFSFLLLAIPLFYLSFQFDKASEEEVLFAEQENKGLSDLLVIDHSYIVERNTIVEKVFQKRLTEVDENFPIFVDLKSRREATLDVSNLILDPQKETYHLIVSSQKIAYEIEEALLKIYISFSGKLSKNEIDSAVKIKESQEVEQNKSDGLILAASLIQSKIKDAVTSYQKFCTEGCPSHLKTNLAKYESNLSRFLGMFSEKQDLKSIHEQLKFVLETSDNIRLQSNALISEKLTARIDKFKFRQKSVLMATFMLWLASIICSYIFYTINVRRIKSYTAQIQNQNEELERVKKLSLLGELAAGIGHEIANPLNIAQISLELINHKLDLHRQQNQSVHLNDVKDLLTRIEKMILNIKQIIRSFRSYAYSGDDETFGYINLEEAVKDSLVLIQYKAAEHGVVIEKEIPEGLKVLGTLHGIEQILINLFNNAIDAMEKVDHKKITIAAYRSDEYVFLDVTDNGVGVAPELREKIFKPLFTTKNSSNGTGLGLGLAKKICGKFGGDLVLVDSSKGAKFRLKLRVS